MGVEIVLVAVVLLVVVGVVIKVKVLGGGKKGDDYSKSSDRKSDGKNVNMGGTLQLPSMDDKKNERNSWNHKTSDGERNSMNLKGRIADRISDKNKNSERNSMNVKSFGERTSAQFKLNSDISSGNNQKQLVLDDPNSNDNFVKLIIKDVKEEHDEEILSPRGMTHFELDSPQNNPSKLNKSLH